MEFDVWKACQDMAEFVGKELKMGREDIEDAAGEVYLKVANQNPESVSFVYRAARWHFIDIIRNRDGRFVPELYDMPEKRDVFAERDDWVDLERKIAGLDQDTQNVLLMEFVGATAQQGAKLLQMTGPAYKSRLYRARRKLKQLNGDTLDGDDTS